MTTRHTPARRLSLLAACCGALLLAGCLSADRSDPLRDAFPAGTISSSELDARVRQLTYRMSLAVQVRAGETYRDASSSEQRVDAAVFVLRMHDEIRRASFAGSPIATLVDIWALNEQMRHRFESGSSKDHGGAAELATIFAGFAEECLEITTAATGRRVATTFAEDVREWARENPIGDDLARASVAPLLADVGVPQQRGLGDISETVGEGLVRVGENIEELQTTLPSVLTWQLAAIAEVRLASLERNVSERLEEVGASIEPAVTAQVDAVMAGIRAERIAIMESVNDQRLAFEATLESLRAAAFRDLDDQRRALQGEIDEVTARAFERLDVQRIATVEDVAAMVDQTLATVDRQRELVVSEMDVIVQTAVDRAVDGAVDRVFWMLAKLGVAALAGLALLAVFVRVLWRRA